MEARISNLTKTEKTEEQARKNKPFFGPENVFKKFSQAFWKWKSMIPPISGLFIYASTFRYWKYFWNLPPAVRVAMQ